MKLLVNVQLPGGEEQRAGTIEDLSGRGHTRAATVSFTYAPDYLASPDAYPLAPSLPLTPGSFTPSGKRSMLAGIADSQPDLWGRRLIDATRRRSARVAGAAPVHATEVEILAAVPDTTRQGSLRFQLIPDEPHVADVPMSRTPTVLELDKLIIAARAFDAGEEIPEEIQELLGAGTSAGGARPKANVRLNDGSIALAKLPRDGDFGDAMAWEATALHLARNAGVTVPGFELTRVGDRSVLVLDRFDRTPGGASSSRRIGYISAESLLDKSPGQLYTYVDLAEAVGRESVDARDTAELFRRVAVTLLINNVDDHMRNHGLLRGNNGWTLSPAFDINPFFRHGSVDSTPVSDTDDPARRDIRNLLDARDAFRLTHSGAVDIIREAESATSHWNEIASTYGLSPEGQGAMAAAFEGVNREAARAMTSVASPAVTPVRASNELARRKGRFPELYDDDSEKPEDPGLTLG